MTSPEGPAPKDGVSGVGSRVLYLCGMLADDGDFFRPHCGSVSGYFGLLHL